MLNYLLVVKFMLKIPARIKIVILKVTLFLCFDIKYLFKMSHLKSQVLIIFVREEEAGILSSKF